MTTWRPTWGLRWKSLWWIALHVAARQARWGTTNFRQLVFTSLPLGDKLSQMMQIGMHHVNIVTCWIYSFPSYANAMQWVSQKHDKGLYSLFLAITCHFRLMQLGAINAVLHLYVWTLKLQSLMLIQSIHFHFGAYLWCFLSFLVKMFHQILIINYKQPAL